jgi:hypothetical protein
MAVARERVAGYGGWGTVEGTDFNMLAGDDGSEDVDGDVGGGDEVPAVESRSMRR